MRDLKQNNTGWKQGGALQPFPFRCYACDELGQRAFECPTYPHYQYHRPRSEIIVNGAVTDEVPDSLEVGLVEPTDDFKRTDKTLVGYWQVEVEVKDCPKTEFATRKGLFQFQVMPFGLYNAPATFERLMETVLAGKPFDEMLTNIGLVFERLSAANLKLKPRKCKLFAQQVEYLGHIVAENGISTDPKKIDVKNWPEPTTVSELRSFIAFCSYYRRFIENFGNVAKLLHSLAQKGKIFAWTDECQWSFDKLKRLLTSTPVLVHQDFKQHIILNTDVSEYSIGAVLSQIQNGHEKVIAFASRSLTKNTETSHGDVEDNLSMKDAQKADSDIQEVKTWLETGSKPSFEEISGKSYAVQYLYCTPKQRRKVLHFCHDTKTYGHLGDKKTLSKIRQHLYRPDMQNDVRQYIAGCEICWKLKHPIKKKQAPMQLIKTGVPMQRIATDILGELPETENGNKYTLVVSDYFTKWTEVFPMANMEAQTVAKIIVEEVVTRFGI
ncbi:unnamed protein product [Mytilus coruscus]|uniref:Integrase catalytic domain-containing protein n=1 Tax=Mytilus coruscus TaxID=42192 RepID=A0A6J8AH08_MYTCO|nr:unnamed protein product [Mytilus coruscus]